MLSPLAVKVITQTVLLDINHLITGNSTKRQILKTDSLVSYRPDRHYFSSFVEGLTGEDLYCYVNPTF